MDEAAFEESRYARMRWNTPLSALRFNRRINAPKAKLKPLAIGRSADLQVGQRLFAIGDPFGLDQSLTSGIVSAIGRTITSVAGKARSAARRPRC